MNGEGEAAHRALPLVHFILAPNMHLALPGTQAPAWGQEGDLGHIHRASTSHCSPCNCPGPKSHYLEYLGPWGHL